MHFGDLTLNPSCQCPQVSGLAFCLEFLPPHEDGTWQLARKIWENGYQVFTAAPVCSRCSIQHLCSSGHHAWTPEPMSSCQQPFIWGGIKSILLLPLAVRSPGGVGGWVPKSQGMTITQPQLLTRGRSQGPIRANKVHPALARGAGAEAHALCPDTEPEETKELLQPSSHHTGSEDGAKEAEPEQRGSETRS